MSCMLCKHWRRRSGESSWGTCNFLSVSASTAQADCVVSGVAIASGDTGAFQSVLVSTHSLFGCMNEDEEVDETTLQNLRDLYTRMETEGGCTQELQDAASQYRYGARV